jgi:pilus assembly protein CpaF
MLSNQPRQSRPGPPGRMRPPTSVAPSPPSIAPGFVASTTRLDPAVVARIQDEASRRLARAGAKSAELVADMEAEIRRVVADEGVSPGVTDQLVRAVLARMSGIGWLQCYLEADDIENVRIIGSEPTFVEYAGGHQSRGEPVAHTDGELIELVRALANRLGRRFGTANPYVHLRLPDGSRLSASMGVCRRPHVALRRHRLMRATLADLVALGTMSPDLAAFLTAAVRAGLNILVAGDMNAGKTTLLRALCAAIPPDESIYLVELVGELGLDEMPDRHPQAMSYEWRDANVEDEGEITMAREVQEAHRFNVKRLLVGEVLGEEVLPMLRAMSTGQKGSMASIHSDTSEGVFERLAAYAGESPPFVPAHVINRRVGHTINLVVYLEMLWEGGNGSGPDLHRVISSVRAVTGTTDDDRAVSSVEIWAPGPDGRAVYRPRLPEGIYRRLAKAGWTP